MQKHWIFIFLPLLGLSAADANGQSAQPVTTAAEPASTLAPTEKSLLWRISGNGLKQPSHLYGTIHLIPQDQFELSEATRVAFDGAQRVAFEIDMKEMTNIGTQLSLMTKALMAGGKTLRDLLPPDDYAFVHAKLGEKGLPTSMLERLKPMFLSMMFAQEGEGMTGGGDAGQAAAMTSVEMELYDMAKKREIKTAGLETAAYQMSVFDSIPYEAQAKMLVESLRSDPQAEGGGEYQEMIRLYRAQDIQAMQAMISNEKYGMGEYEDLLLDKRNANWIPVMGKLMQEGQIFFAVGAGHLGGEKGVVALLRKAGYKVEAVLQ
jgi:uncharacterized protein YbaP (TraB family)